MGRGIFITTLIDLLVQEAFAQHPLRTWPCSKREEMRGPWLQGRRGHVTCMLRVDELRRTAVEPATRRCWQAGRSSPGAKVSTTPWDGHELQPSPSRCGSPSRAAGKTEPTGHRREQATPCWNKFRYYLAIYLINTLSMPWLLHVRYEL